MDEPAKVRQKYPRFSIRLMLLLVALMAMCFASWRAAENKQISDREWRRTHLEYTIRIWERKKNAEQVKKFRKELDDLDR